MKKFLCFGILMVTLSSSIFAQKNWNFRVGLVAPIPANVQSSNNVKLGSTLFEISYKASNKVSLVANSGFLSFQDFTNVPVLGGARYFVNSNLYMGVSAGVAIFNEGDNEIMYTPHVGYQKGHVSLDAHYIDWRKTDDSYNNIALCLSYTL